MLYYSLDADNKKAREGLERVEKQGDVLADGSYDVECEDLDAIGNEVRNSCVTDLYKVY